MQQLLSHVFQMARDMQLVQLKVDVASSMLKDSKPQVIREVAFALSVIELRKEEQPKSML